METTETPPKKREWVCARCKNEIDIFVSDEDRKYRIEGDKIYCSSVCKSYAKQYIPVDPIKKKINKNTIRNNRKIKKNKGEPLFKCFSCETTTTLMTWDKLCTKCKVPDMTSEQKSLIRLYVIN